MNELEQHILSSANHLSAPRRIILALLLLQGISPDDAYKLVLIDRETGERFKVFEISSICVFYREDSGKRGWVTISELHRLFDIEVSE